jgi:hypothetical protein
MAKPDKKEIDARKNQALAILVFALIAIPHSANDPSSATPPTGYHDCNSCAMAGLDAMKGCVARRRLAPGPGYENRSNPT